jgi:hypothetical protein
MLKRHFAFIALAIAALTLVACDDAPESGRAIVAVSNINGGNPVTSSVSLAADDVVPMEFRFRPYNMFNTITEAAPHGDIIIEHYTVTWTRTDGGTALPSRQETTSIFLSVYEPATSGVRLVTAAEKGSVTGVPVVMEAHIEFTAREMGTEEEIKFSTHFSVSFNT